MRTLDPSAPQGCFISFLGIDVIWATWITQLVEAQAPAPSSSHATAMRVVTPTTPRPWLRLSAWSLLKAAPIGLRAWNRCLNRACQPKNRQKHSIVEERLP
jgi:hypothetical protein